MGTETESVSSRKVVQLSVTGVANTVSTQCNWVCVALCEDGSMWVNRQCDDEWGVLPPIPARKEGV
jgi:hypothetical protein